MPERISRRELARRGLLSAAALTVPSLVAARPQDQPKPDPHLDEKVARVEAKLAKPLTERARELLKGSIAAGESAAQGRWQHKLPENSEPCFLYVVTPARKASR